MRVGDISHQACMEGQTATTIDFAANILQGHALLSFSSPKVSMSLGVSLHWGRLRTGEILPTAPFRSTVLCRCSRLEAANNSNAHAL